MLSRQYKTALTSFINEILPGVNPSSMTMSESKKWGVEGTVKARLVKVVISRIPARQVGPLILSMVLGELITNRDRWICTSQGVSVKFSLARQIILNGWAILKGSEAEFNSHLKSTNNTVVIPLWVIKEEDNGNEKQDEA